MTPLLSFPAGAWVLQQQSSLPSLWWAYLLLLCIVVRWLARDGLGRLRAVVDVPLWIGTGFLWAALVAHVKLADRLPSEWEGVDITVQGVVADLPQSFDRGVRFRFEVEQVFTPMAIVPKAILLSYYRQADVGLPTFHAGERWRLSVRLKRAHAAQNPHLFDREYWLLEQGVRATGYIRPKAFLERVATLVPHPGFVLERTREIIRDRIVQALPERASAGVLVALAVGDQAAIGSEDWQLFSRTGVNHLMSISGLHITMLSALAAWITAWAWRRSARLTRRMPARRAALLVALMVAWGYAALAGFGVPAQRTVLMLSTVGVALLLGRVWSSTIILSLALFVVTLVDPMAVMSAGFWLSFGAVAILIYAGSGRIGRASLVLEWARTQWVMTIGLIPFLVILFQQISIVSPLANAFAIPLVSLIVVPMTLLGVVSPGSQVLVFSEQVMTWCVGLLRILDTHTLSVWQQAVPPVWMLVLACAGVLWSLAPKGFPSRWMGYGALLPMFLYVTPTPGHAEFWMDVLDVGQGLSTVMRTRNHTLLFDAGPRYSEDSDAGDRIVTPYLRAAGVKRLDGLIISHDDNDHTGGANSVSRTIPAAWMASSLRDAHELHASSAVSRRCHAGQVWQWDGVTFEMLHPTLSSYQGPRIKDNNRSCVLRVSSPAGRVLIPADIEAAAENQLSRENPESLRAEVLLAPHHGSGTSSTEDFLRNVAPGDVIFTNGYRNSYGHPKEEVVQRYVRTGTRVFRSDRDGAVLYRFTTNGIEAHAWRTLHRRYWHD